MTRLCNLPRAAIWHVSDPKHCRLHRAGDDGAGLRTDRAEAQFSVPFNVALGLVTKRPSFVDFTPRNFQKPEIRASWI